MEIRSEAYSSSSSESEELSDFDYYSDDQEDRKKEGIEITKVAASHMCRKTGYLYAFASGDDIDKAMNQARHKSTDSAKVIMI